VIDTLRHPPALACGCACHQRGIGPARIERLDGDAVAGAADQLFLEIPTLQRFHRSITPLRFIGRRERTGQFGVGHGAHSPSARARLHLFNATGGGEGKSPYRLGQLCAKAETPPGWGGDPGMS
jgi:hypothetical protein